MYSDVVVVVDCYYQMVIHVVDDVIDVSVVV
jgi:hypothetical protein